jgi:hypothetical protein
MFASVCDLKKESSCCHHIEISLAEELGSKARGTLA